MHRSRTSSKAGKPKEEGDQWDPGGRAGRTTASASFVARELLKTQKI